MKKQGRIKVSPSDIYYGKGGKPRYSVENKGWYERPAAIKYFFQALRDNDQATVIAFDPRAKEDLIEWEANNPLRVAKYAEMAGVPKRPIKIKTAY